jgi:hypothetical protein
MKENFENSYEQINFIKNPREEILFKNIEDKTVRCRNKSNSIKNKYTNIRNNNLCKKLDTSEKNSNLDLLSKDKNVQVVKKSEIIISNKDSIFNSSKKIKIKNFIENEILNSYKKEKNKKLYYRESFYSNLENSNENEKLQMLIETPKLCDKKRYRNTTSAKPKGLYDDIYMKTSSTLNQTPIISYDQNSKKNHIEMDKRIVKNLQYKY